MRKFGVFTMLLAGMSGYAQIGDTSSVHLNTVELQASSLKKTDAKATVEIKKLAPLVNTVSVLNTLPGVSSQEGVVNTAKFTYRGFGARSQYTTSRSLFYLNDIPITGLQGFSTFEDINPAYIKAANMYQAGVAGYPAALGGVVRLSTIGTQISSDQNHEFSNQFMVGSFGLIGNNLMYSNKQHQLTVGYENLSKEGWRDNSRLKRQSLLFSGDRLFGTNLRLLVYGIKNRSEIPSSLSQSDFENNPQKAADSWENIEGYEAYDKLITGLTWSNNQHASKGASQKNIYSVTAFYQYRNGFEPRPFNILDDESHHGGLRTTYKRKVSGRLTGEFDVFAEYHIGTEHANTFENMFDTLTNTHNNRGASINSTRLVSQLVHAGAGWGGSFGKKDVERFIYSLRLNSYYRYNQSKELDAQSYSSPFILAPRATIGYSLKKNRKVELAYYQAYSIPSLEENLDPDGSLNAELRPEESWTIELGFSQFKVGKTAILNLYYTEVRNLIVPRLVGPDQVVATNAGSSLHTGIELAYNLDRSIQLNELKGHGSFGYGLSFNGYYGYFGYKNFSDTTGIYDGNRLPGFPEWQATVIGDICWMKYNTTNGDKTLRSEFTIAMQAQVTSGFYVNDQNTVRNQPYLLVQAWLGYQRILNIHWIIEPRIGVKNITDEKYAGMTVVNNQAFGNTPPRYYYPGEPINWFCSLTLAYRI